jgi:hypothetical protein
MLSMATGAIGVHSGLSAGGGHSSGGATGTGGASALVFLWWALGGDCRRCWEGALVGLRVERSFVVFCVVIGFS